jgi:major membrane immunogen (membrane-anchored lipoprotein)
VGKEIKVKDLTIGKKYRVEFSDCCVDGFFVGTLQDVDRDDGWLQSVTFDTGKVEAGSYNFYEVD